MSNLFVWNIYEKSFTPYWASIAPKHQVHRHQIQRKPSRVSSFCQDTKTKAIFRFLRKTILKKAYWYSTSILLCKIIFNIIVAILVEYTVRNSFISAYRKKNYTVKNISLYIRDH
jgi:hypothetical protein